MQRCCLGLPRPRSSIASQLAAVNAPIFSVNPAVTVSNNMAYVSGVAPVAVETVWINGEAWPMTWTTLTNWTVAVPLHARDQSTQRHGGWIFTPIRLLATRPAWRWFTRAQLRRRRARW